MTYDGRQLHYDFDLDDDETGQATMLGLEKLLSQDDLLASS